MINGFVSMIIIIINIYSFETFFRQRKLMAFHLEFEGHKSPQVFKTLFSILSDLSNAVVGMVSTCPIISKSSTTCINPSAPITTGITVTFMF